MTLDELHAAMREVRARGGSDKALEHFLRRCPDGECSECGEIVCPKGERLHFHHDGCPSCTIDDYPL